MNTYEYASTLPELCRQDNIIENIVRSLACARGGAHAAVGPLIDADGCQSPSGEVLMGSRPQLVCTSLPTCSLIAMAPAGIFFSPPLSSSGQFGWPTQSCQARVLGRRVDVALAFGANSQVLAWTVTFSTLTGAADAQQLFEQVSQQLRLSFQQYGEERLETGSRWTFVAANRALTCAFFVPANGSGYQVVVSIQVAPNAAQGLLPSGTSATTLKPLNLQPTVPIL